MNRSAHGLRKAAATVAAENGATEAELDAISMDHRANVYSLTEKPGAGNRAKSSMESDGGLKDGGHDRDRTCDPYHVKVVLSR
jgi:hypothetical protein